VDGPRYKQLGNSVTVSVIEFITRNRASVLADGRLESLA
jgi:site-specific DNA-cytosine methylase